MWFRSRSFHRNLGPRPHDLHEPEAWWPSAVSRKRGSACVPCGTIRSRRCNRCSHCKRILQPETSLLVTSFRIADSLDTRMLPHPRHPPHSSQPVPLGDPFDDSPLPELSHSGYRYHRHDKQLLADLRRASAMAIPRCIVSPHAIAWAESLEGAVSGHQSWAVLCRSRCRPLLAEVPKGSDRNAALGGGRYQ